MGKQAELFQAETTWFHVFKDMIDSGDVAKMGPHATTVYLVIKAHTNFSTGRAFPSIETIVAKSGISDKQVRRELRTLEELGYISKEKRGRNNVYTLREKVAITDDEGRPTAVATWDYLPSTVSHAVADLKNVLVTGELAGARIVHIEKLQVQIINGDNNSPVQINEASKPDLSEENLMRLAESNPALFEKVAAMRARALAKKQASES